MTDILSGVSFWVMWRLRTLCYFSTHLSKLIDRNNCLWSQCITKELRNKVAANKSRSTVNAVDFVTPETRQTPHKIVEFYCIQSHNGIPSNPKADKLQKMHSNTTLHSFEFPTLIWNPHLVHQIWYRMNSPFNKTIWKLSYANLLSPWGDGRLYDVVLRKFHDWLQSVFSSLCWPFWISM
jgi:hypothetical protein